MRHLTQFFNISHNSQYSQHSQYSFTQPKTNILCISLKKETNFRFYIPCKKYFERFVLDKKEQLEEYVFKAMEKEGIVFS